jgi:hypothetical protein
MSPHFWPRILSTCRVFAWWFVRNRSPSWSAVQSWVFLVPEWSVHVQRWSPRGPPEGLSETSYKALMPPMEVEKKVCQRLSDQDSSLWWDLNCPRHLIGLKKRTLLGTSSSWDSRPVISSEGQRLCSAGIKNSNPNIGIRGQVGGSRPGQTCKTPKILCTHESEERGCEESGIVWCVYAWARWVGSARVWDRGAYW